MRAKQLYLVLLLLLIVYQQTGVGQDKPTEPADGSAATSELDTQLEINRKALFEGSVDAADIMLFDQNPSARKILLDALKQT